MKRVCFLPTECGVPEDLHRAWGSNGNRPYVVAAPEAVLEDPTTMANFLSTVARVAHANHVQLVLPSGTDYFAEEGPSAARDVCLDLSIRKQISASIATIGLNGDYHMISDGKERTNIGGLCVDQRVTRELPAYLDETEKAMAETKQRVGLQVEPVHYGRVRLPGSLLLLHPDALTRLSPEHRDFCMNTLDAIRSHANWKINSLINHVGIDGAPGCGGVALLRKLGMEIRDTAHEIDLFKQIRDLYNDIMSTNCQIKLDFVRGTAGTTVERIPVDNLSFDSSGNLVGNKLIAI